MSGTPAAWWLPPTYTLHAQTDALLVHDHLSNTTLTLTGRLPTQVLGAEVSGTFESLAAHQPELAALANALREHGAPVPLDRRTLLRGTGYAQLFLELTGRCNERCRHCYAESSPERTDALPRKVLARVIEDASRLGFRSLQLTGGDPLVSPDCLWAARFAREQGIPQLEIYTNGLALVGRLYAGLRDVGAAFAFSYYAHDPCTHDRITGTPGSHRRTTAAIRRVVVDGLPLRVNVIVMDENRSQLDATLGHLVALGVPEGAIGMDVQRSVGRGQMTIPEGALVRHRTPASPPKPAAGHHTGPASGLFGRAAVASNGTVYPCIFSRNLALGSVYRQRLWDILEATEPLANSGALDEPSQHGRNAHLACWDCRLRAAFLTCHTPGQRAPEPTLEGPERELVTGRADHCTDHAEAG